MAFKGSDGLSYSYESDELIEDVLEDIAEFGEDEEVIGFYIERSDIRLFTHYEFDVPEDPVRVDELKDGEHMTRITLRDLLIHLDKQNRII